MPDALNKLYYGDNLQVLREHIAEQSVDLVYLDPPFNSRQDYNVLFAEKDGNRSAAQITAFKDTWEWNLESQAAFEEIVERGGRVADAMRAFKTLLGNTDMMAYLAMMAPRLVELRLALKESGSIYLHCDPTASHYLKLLMDAVFGTQMFHSEIIWKRNSAHSDAKRFGSVHDTILFYSKGSSPFWNTQFQAYDPTYVEQYYRYKDPDGRSFMSGDLSAAGLQGGGYTYEWKGVTRVWRVPQTTMERLDSENRVFYTRNGIPRMKRYLDESKGMPAQDVWTDIESLKSWMAERLGYPTQKPEALLERILKASSNEGDAVLDPFCGCGTTVQVAQSLNRRWTGIDITHLAIGLIKNRLATSFGDAIKPTYVVIGEPTDLAGAKQLAEENKFQFQAWALGLVDARVADSDRRGADRGIDGKKIFFDDNSSNAKQIVFSVKGGASVQDSELRDLVGVLSAEKAEMGAFISLAKPTRPMKLRAAEAGFYTSSDGSRYPRLQLLTIKGLLEGTERLERPRHIRDATFKNAPRHKTKPERNLTLALSANPEDDE
jgi:DNA modification methylase